jgi:23S rRNA (guanosine2251-2'-O)-methyltransferase
MPRPVENREWICGRQPVRELLLAGRRRVFSMQVVTTVRPTPEIDECLALAQRKGVRIDRVPPSEFRIPDGDAHHQGLAVEAAPYPYTPWDELLLQLRRSATPPFILALDHIQDPQNLGSLLRTANALGVHGVLIPVDRASGVTPAAVRASAGAAEHMVVAQVVNLVRSMEALKKEELWFTGLEKWEGSKPLHTMDFKGPVGLVVGSEGYGLGRLVRETCDFLAEIPMQGQVGSLNAGVAGAIAMYEIQRQRCGQSSA